MEENAFYWMFINHAKKDTVAVNGPLSKDAVDRKLNVLMNAGYVELESYANKHDRWQGMKGHGQVMPPKSFFIVIGQHAPIALKAEVKE